MQIMATHKTWIALAVSIALGLVGLSAVHAKEPSPASTHKQNLVVHLGHATDDIHSADMALHIGANLLKHGAQVTLFVDREGARIVDSRLPIDALTWGTNNIGEDYEAFIQAGGHVLVCPGCAENQGLTSELLRAGAVIGTPDSVAAALLEANKVIDF